jgi:hypothetical protein
MATKTHAFLDGASIQATRITKQSGSATALSVKVSGRWRRVKDDGQEKYVILHGGVRVTIPDNVFNLATGYTK